MLRWNDSHDNHGPGLLVYTHTGAAFRGRDCRVGREPFAARWRVGNGVWGLAGWERGGVPCRGPGGNAENGDRSGGVRSGAAHHGREDPCDGVEQPRGGALARRAGGVVRAAPLRAPRAQSLLAGGWEPGVPDRPPTVRPLSERSHPEDVETRFRAADEAFGDSRLSGVPGRDRTHPLRRMSPHWPCFHHGWMDAVGARRAGGRDGSEAAAGMTQGCRGVSRAGRPGNRGID